jgi:hypothetical protein
MTLQWIEDFREIHPEAAFRRSRSLRTIVNMLRQSARVRVDVPHRYCQEPTRMKGRFRPMASASFVALFVALDSGRLHSQEAAPDTPPTAAPADTAFEFTGLSDERSFDVALRDALRQMDEAVAKYGKYPCTSAKWRVAEISGETGGPASVNTLAVRVAASFEVRESDPGGTWKVSRSSGGEQMAGFTLTLRRDGEQVTGTINWPDGKTSEIGAASWRDGTLRFRVTPGSVVQDYSGRLLGDTITGKWAAGIGVFEWRAERAAADKQAAAKGP